MATKMGCTVITAESGEEGIQKFKSQNPDIVLCDLMMPEMDGFDVLTTIKKMGKVPVFLFVTADVQDHTQQKALELGAKGLISKPLTEESLQKVLNQYGTKR